MFSEGLGDTVHAHREPPTRETLGGQLPWVQAFPMGSEPSGAQQNDARDLCVWTPEEGGTRGELCRLGRWGAALRL